MKFWFLNVWLLNSAKEEPGSKVIFFKKNQSKFQNTALLMAAIWIDFYAQTLQRRFFLKTWLFFSWVVKILPEEFKKCS